MKKQINQNEKKTREPVVTGTAPRSRKMKQVYILLLLFLFSACMQTNKGANGTSDDKVEKNLTEETVEHPINGNNIAVVNTDKINSSNEAVVSTEYLYYSSIFSNDYGEKSIKYISWGNTVKFIDYETIAWSANDPRVTRDAAYYFGTYALNVQDNITFLDVHFDNGNEEKWLILANGTLCHIYMPDGRHISGVTGSVNRTENISVWPGTVSSSSFLIENNISYSSDNLNIYYWTDKPWAEGAEGHGINEKIFFENKVGININGPMHISIGYVSYDKPYLYSQNSRPKKIKLSVENKFSIIVDLKDTPHYQKIILPSSIYGNDILILEILDVYPGTKYEDTCINTIFFEWNSGYYEYNNYWEEQPD